MLHWQHSYLESLFSWTFILFYTKRKNLICWTSSAAVGIDTFYPKWGVTMNKGPESQFQSTNGITYQVQQHLPRTLLLFPGSTCPAPAPAQSFSLHFATSSSLQILGFQVTLIVGELRFAWLTKSFKIPFISIEKTSDIQFTCSACTAKNPPWGSNWRSPNINIEYCWVYLWKNPHLCCFVPTVTQNFREMNDMSYRGFIQMNVNKIYDLFFPPRLVKWTLIKFYCQTDSAAQNFSNNFLQNSPQDAHLKPYQLLFG